MLFQVSLWTIFCALSFPMFTRVFDAADIYDTEIIVQSSTFLSMRKIPLT